MQRILFLIFSTVLINSCADDLSGVPDQSVKVVGMEPESFSFEKATTIKVGSRTFPASIYSSVPASSIRYYQITLGYFDVGTTLGSLKAVSLINSTDSLALSWFDEDKNLQISNPTTLDFTTAKDFFEDGCFNCNQNFYISVNNMTNSEIDYQIIFEFVKN